MVVEGCWTQVADPALFDGVYPLPPGVLFSRSAVRVAYSLHLAVPFGFDVLTHNALLTCPEAPDQFSHEISLWRSSHHGTSALASTPLTDATNLSNARVVARLYALPNPSNIERRKPSAISNCAPLPPLLQMLLVSRPARHIVSITDSNPAPLRVLVTSNFRVSFARANEHGAVIAVHGCD
jgi:hypothetical protein